MANYARKRRDFFRDMAKAGLLLPFASQLLAGRRAFGESAAANRLIMIYYPNGAVLETWHPKFKGRLRKGMNLSYALDPLSPFADKMILLRHLTTKGHGGSSSHTEAASQIASGGLQGEVTIDVAIGNEIGTNQSFKNIHIGLFNRYNNGKKYLLFRDAGGRSILPEDDPAKVANQLFGNSGPMDPEYQERNLNILEILSGDLGQLRALDLGGQSTEKLDVHSASLDHLKKMIEKNLNLFQSCQVPLPVGMGADRRSNNIIGEDLVEAQFDNLVAAFQCDLTRVASFQFMSAQDESLYINFDSIKSELDKADSGGFGSTKKWWNQNLSHSSSHQASDVFRVQNRWYNMMVAKLCQKLDQTQDPLGGGSLFDTSLICMFSENGQSANHGLEDVGWYLLGGSNGTMDMGKVLDCQGAGSSNLLLELARSMGLGWKSFGNSSEGLPGLYDG